MATPANPWEKFEAKSWKEEIPELENMLVGFREAGDIGALVDVVFSKALGSDKNVAIANLVCTSVYEPHLTTMQFNALAMQAKLALFNAIMAHVGEGKTQDFTSANAPGQTRLPSPTPTPEDGSGLGGQPTASVTVLPNA